MTICGIFVVRSGGFKQICSKLWQTVADLWQDMSDLLQDVENCGRFVASCGKLWQVVTSYSDL